MAACDPASLINTATCIHECIPEGMQMAVANYLACQIASGNGSMSTPCDPASLITEATCINECIPAGMQLPVLIATLCQILQNGGISSAPGFVSAVAPLVSTNLYTFPHGLGVIPSRVSAVIKMINNDAGTGFTAGQEIVIQSVTDNVIQAPEFSVWQDATNVYVQSAHGLLIHLGDADLVAPNGAGSSFSAAANLGIKVYAWV